MAGKLPYIMLYPSDWEGDEIDFCSLAAQGLWLRMIFLMHKSARYGYLVLPTGLPVPDEMLAKKCGISVEVLQSLLSELEHVGKLTRSKGIIFSKRMIRDDEARANGRFRVKKHRNSKKTNDNCNASVTDDVTPMSQGYSSSIAVSITEHKTPTPFPSESDPPSLENLPPEMVASAVMDDCSLGGRHLLNVLTEVARREIKKGKAATALREAMSAAWAMYAKSKPKLEYACGAEKFFGEGLWADSHSWPWKPEHRPQPKRVYVNS